jgi:hypothetical protein
MGSHQMPAVTMSTTDRDRQEKNAAEIAQKMGAVMQGFDSITKWVALSKMIAQETSAVPDEFAPGILNQINQAAIMEHQNIKSEK